uniref:Uncharacterized protein n=1 Tax=Oryza punctata TaxID=4537 RepID=A0A0E0LDQ3_ORYPU
MEGRSASCGRRRGGGVVVGGVIGGGWAPGDVEDADAVPVPGVRGDDGAHRGGAARAGLHAPQEPRRRGGGGVGQGDGAARQGAQGRRHHGRRHRAVLPRQRQAARPLPSAATTGRRRAVGETSRAANCAGRDQFCS